MKKSKLLRICVIGNDIYTSQAIQNFIKKGHTVGKADYQFREFDVIIGPQCWRIDPRIKLGDDTIAESLERQLEMMEKGVRAIKFPKEKKNDG